MSRLTPELEQKIRADLEESDVGGDVYVAILLDEIDALRNDNRLLNSDLAQLWAVQLDKTPIEAIHFVNVFTKTIQERDQLKEQLEKLTQDHAIKSRSKWRIFW